MGGYIYPEKYLALHDFSLDPEELLNICPNLIVACFRFDFGADATKLPVGDVFQCVTTHESSFAKKHHRYQTDFGTLALFPSST